ncbi:MAG TPA: nuclear transport factor 2 family protein [Candidatus Eisenbacteria bacterium]|nr:nuclear transport factor 2 family protein [Candidatus Eisenbacteria bacterium]
MLTLAEATRLFDARRAAWLREDLGAYLALWADDMVFEAPSHPEPLRGREAFAELVHRSNEITRPLRFNVLHLAIAGEDVVLAEWVITVEHRQSAKTITWRGMSRCTMRGGLISHWREYWNPADLAGAGSLAVQR